MRAIKSDLVQGQFHAAGKLVEVTSGRGRWTIDASGVKGAMARKQYLKPHTFIPELDVRAVQATQAISSEDEDATAAPTTRVDAPVCTEKLAVSRKHNDAIRHLAVQPSLRHGDDVWRMGATLEDRSFEVW